MRNPSDVAYWTSRANNLWDIFTIELNRHGIGATYVIRTDFIRWISDDIDRTKDYLEDGDITHLVTNYSRELRETEEENVT